MKSSGLCKRHACIQGAARNLAILDVVASPIKAQYVPYYTMVVLSWLEKLTRSLRTTAKPSNDRTPNGFNNSKKKPALSVEPRTGNHALKEGLKLRLWVSEPLLSPVPNQVDLWAPNPLRV